MIPDPPPCPTLPQNIVSFCRNSPANLSLKSCHIDPTNTSARCDGVSQGLVSSRNVSNAWETLHWPEVVRLEWDILFTGDAKEGGVLGQPMGIA